MFVLVICNLNVLDYYMFINRSLGRIKIKYVAHFRDYIFELSMLKPCVRLFLRCNIFFLWMIIFLQRKWLNYHRKERQLQYPLVWCLFQWCLILNRSVQFSSFTLRKLNCFENIESKTNTKNAHNERYLYLPNCSIDTNIGIYDKARSPT